MHHERRSALQGHLVETYNSQENGKTNKIYQEDNDSGLIHHLGCDRLYKNGIFFIVKHCCRLSYTTFFLHMHFKIFRDHRDCQQTFLNNALCKWISLTMNIREVKKMETFSNVEIKVVLDASQNMNVKLSIESKVQLLPISSILIENQ